MIKVKVCGITNIEDAIYSSEAGADALGFIFYKKSPRHVSIDKAREICLRLPPFISRVGVFVNEETEHINSIAEYCQLNCVQLHGDETHSFCSGIKVTVIKAIRVNGQSVKKEADRFDVGAILLDTYSEKAYGGTGETFDWSLASALTKENRIILSGGLNCSNILGAVRSVRPYAVDVCSGVEKSKGKKDIHLLKKFIHLVKSSHW